MTDTKYLMGKAPWEWAFFGACLVVAGVASLLHTRYGVGSPDAATGQMLVLGVIMAAGGGYYHFNGGNNE